MGCEQQCYNVTLSHIGLPSDRLYVKVKPKDPDSPSRTLGMKNIVSIYLVYHVGLLKVQWSQWTDSNINIIKQAVQHMYTIF